MTLRARWLPAQDLQAQAGRTNGPPKRLLQQNPPESRHVLGQEPARVRGLIAKLSGQWPRVVRRELAIQVVAVDLPEVRHPGVLKAKSYSPCGSLPIANAVKVQTAARDQRLMLNGRDAERIRELNDAFRRSHSAWSPLGSSATSAVTTTGRPHGHHPCADRDARRRILSVPAVPPVEAPRKIYWPFIFSCSG
jgi:hypothetical protein